MNENRRTRDKAEKLCEDPPHLVKTPTSGRDPGHTRSLDPAEEWLFVSFYRRWKHRLRSHALCIADGNASTLSNQLTLHNEVDAGGLGVVVRLHRAGVGALIVHVHVLDHDAVLGRRVHQDDHTRVYGPLVIPGVEDGAAVQPGHPGDPVVNRAPGERTRQVSQGTTKKHMPSGSSWQGWDDWSPCSQCTQGHLLFGLARV